MAQMFRKSDGGAIVCADCLAADEEMVSARLARRHFPGTYERLTCSRCGTTGGSPVVATREGASRAVAAPPPPLDTLHLP